MQMELIPGQIQHISFEDPATMLKMMEAATAAANPPAATQPGTGSPIQPGIAQPGVGQPGVVQQPAGSPAAQTAQQPQFPAGQQVPPRIER
jgi:hypothetical protein